MKILIFPLLYLHLHWNGKRNRFIYNEFIFFILLPFKLNQNIYGSEAIPDSFWVW